MHRPFVSLLLCLLVFTTPAAAQDASAPPQSPPRQFAEKPLWILWHTGFSEQRALSYVKRVAQDTGIAQDLISQLRDVLNTDTPAAPTAKGTAMFLVKGFIPDVVTVEFQELAEGSSLDEIAAARSKQLGGQVTGEGNLRCASVTITSMDRVMEMTEVTQPDGSTVRRPQAAKDENGEVVTRLRKWTVGTYLRQEGNVLFEADFPELHSMTLPSPDVLRTGTNRRREDLYFQADLQQVPKGFKNLFWNTVQAQANSMLQQRDGEAIAPYEFRRAAADVGLDLLRSLVFDLDEATASVELATESRPVRARLNLRVRSTSQLARSLAGLKKIRPQLPASDKDVLSVRSGWAMPERFRKLLLAAGPWLRTELQPRNESTAAAVDQIARAIEATAEQGNFEAMINFDGTIESGPVLYGAIRIAGAERLTDPLYELVSYGLSQIGEPNLPSVDVVRSAQGADYVRLAFPDIPWPVPEKPDHLFLHCGAGSLWFALGGGTAYRMIEVKQSAPSGRGRADLLSVHVDLQKLFDDTDSTGLTGFAEQFDRTVFALMDETYAGLLFVEQQSELPPLRDVLTSTLGARGARVSLRAGSDARGLFLRGEADESIASYATARYLTVVNRLIPRMEAQQAAMEELREAAVKAGREAADAAPKSAPDIPDAPRTKQPRQ